MKSIHKRLAEALAFNPMNTSRIDPDTGERLQGRKWFPPRKSPEADEDDDEDEDDYARYLSSKEDGSGVDESAKPDEEKKKEDKFQKKPSSMSILKGLNKLSPYKKNHSRRP